MIYPLVGHLELRDQLGTAIANDRLPQVFLLTGPNGVGKQRLALWAAQRLLCQGSDGIEPCGRCSPCRKVLNLAHPDLHWIVPIPRPKASDPAKQVDEAETAIADIMGERRENPLYGMPDGMASHGIASARLIGRRVALTPVESHHKILIIGYADRLVPQESSPEAANALLKLLEEPARDTIIFLTTTDLGRVLPTIRSRAIPLRVGRVSESTIRAYLTAHLDPLPTPAELDERIRRAEGSIGAAIAEDEAWAKAQGAATALLDAITSSDQERYARCLAQAPWQARGEFSAMLEALAWTLNDAARNAVGGRPRRPLPQALAQANNPERLLTAIDRVDEARALAQGNTNPQIVLATLTDELAEGLA